MKILVIDDEPLALEMLVETIERIKPNATIYAFRKCTELLEKAKTCPCNVAFLDIEMRNMSGIELAKRLKQINPSINIIFVTGYSQYMGDAFSMHASGYLLKPITEKMVEKELDHLRHPIFSSYAPIRIQTFGNFEIFVEGVPLSFSRSKSKELLALLVDRRGASLTTAEIASILWENREYNRSLKNQVQNSIVYLLDTLRSVNCQDIITRGWNSISINTSRIVCDYYEFLKGDVPTINSFTGEYMTNYSWAEFTTGFLYAKALK